MTTMALSEAIGSRGKLEENRSSMPDNRIFFLEGKNEPKGRKEKKREKGEINHIPPPPPGVRVCLRYASSLHGRRGA